MKICTCRTPHIFEQINEQLDNKSLVKCKESSRIISNEIEKHSRRFLTTRIIQSYLKNSKKFGKDWKNVCQKLSIDSLKEFSILVKEFYHVFPKRLEQSWSPMHVVVERGDFDFCKLIAKTNAVKSPLSQDEWMPIHFASQAGNFELFKFLSEDIEHKNPRTDNGLSLLHLAAKNGYLEIFQFTSESVIEKNPSMDKGITPLHLAAQNGHFDICKYICDNITDVRPWRSDGCSPLHLALHRFQLKIAILLIKNDVDNIQADVFSYFLASTGVCMFHTGILSFWVLCMIINQIITIYNSFLFLTEEAYSHSGLQTRELGQIYNSFCDGNEYEEYEYDTIEYNEIDEYEYDGMLEDLSPTMIFVYMIAFWLVLVFVIAPISCFILLFLFRLLKDIWFCYWKSPILDH